MKWFLASQTSKGFCINWFIQQPRLVVVVVVVLINRKIGKLKNDNSGDKYKSENITETNTEISSVPKIIKLTFLTRSSLYSS